MKRKYLSIIVCILLMLITASACGEPDFPTGTFSSEGEWQQYEFKEDGKWILRVGGSINTEGTYSVQDNELTLETDLWCDAMEGVSTKATYTWTFKSETLIFEVKGEDKCTMRLDIINSTPFYKD